MTFDPGEVPDRYARRDDPETSHGYGDTDAQHKFTMAAYLFLRDYDRPEGWTWYEVSKQTDLGQCPWRRFTELHQKRLAHRLYDDNGKMVKRTGGSNRPQAVWRIGRP